MILTIIAFVFVLGILIFVHELGHFLAAKKSGVKVEEFALGFPPRLYSFKRGETNYTINLFPIGGYVKMLGELEHSNDPRAFENQSPGKRFIISIAGVLMNVLLAWFILSVGFAAGMAPIVSNPNQIPGKKISTEIIVASIVKDSVAEKAGLKQSDILISGKSDSTEIVFQSVESVIDFTKGNAGKEVTIKYERDKNISEQTVKISDNQDSPLGVSIVERSIVRVSWYKAPVVALRETGRIIKVTFEFLQSFVSNLFKTRQISEGVGGPVAIYVYTGFAVKAGLMVFLQFIALLSINLALINILPFPALDGGRLLFIILERLIGRRVVKEKIENLIHTIGFALLLALIVLITYRDIVKLF